MFVCVGGGGGKRGEVREFVCVLVWCVCWVGGWVGGVCVIKRCVYL